VLREHGQNRPVYLIHCGRLLLPWHGYHNHAPALSAICCQSC
jgi:hypothetical protein